MTDLRGKVAFVTGASSGLGARFCEVLAKAGARVALAARRADRLTDLVQSITSQGGHAVAVPLDVADVSAIGPALDVAEKALGPLSIIVNNAGVGGAGLALDIPVETFDETFAVNVRGVYFGAREAAKRMLANGVAEAGQARIINVASIGAFANLGALTTYCASKAAVASLTKGLAREWGPKGIAVNALCPGFIETELNSAWIPTEAGQRTVNRFLRKRVMELQSLDEALLLLAGPAAAAITGTLLTVDDGQSL
ncbi:SDR family NAD(P)-dependent oxidoreductase [Terricaulis silvestris]|uniref:D-xylose 1-dehydrogenase n=1 Tax=Terricaulis silvestris TaxID=2686094 RepID=A0A6I6MKV6_9CAUL|nr:SDR family NAD(P)-dependent oxidoreductase [Terricaulis silvestris]QGZ93796.1 putative oxidoreductase [Terricaulis silvestris]